MAQMNTTKITDTISTYDHYHIDNGNPCLDEYKDIINKYSEEKQLYFVMDTIIQYLVYGDNDHSCYCNKDDWFQYRKKYKRNITTLL